MLAAVLLLIVGIAVILVCCELFTNSVEWLGKRLNLGEGAVGSILAAVGTALPETLLPIVAIVFVGGEASNEIGIGAILGAPFMLSTAAFFVTGTAVLIFSAQGRRAPQMKVNNTVLERDMRFFLVIYAVAIAATFIPNHLAKVAVAIGLLGLYLFYVIRTLNDESALAGELNPLYLARNHEVPPTVLVILQVLISLAGIIFGARVFVANMETVAHALGASPLVLSLIIAPLATELPEKFNSVLWVRNTKDTLAMGNISGAMVFQSCIPVAVGLILTSWELEAPALASALIALASTTIIYSIMRRRNGLSGHILIWGGLFYLAFIGYIAFFL